MKYIAILCLLLSGCALMKEMNGEAKAARIARRERETQAEQDELKRQELQKTVTKEGTSISDFKAAWGEPDFTDFANGTTLLNYKEEHDTRVFGFKNDKLSEWKTIERAKIPTEQNCKWNGWTQSMQCTSK